MLSVNQGGIKYHFLSLLYDSTLNWTPVSLVFGEHSTHLEKGRYIYIYMCVCVCVCVCVYVWVCVCVCVCVCDCLR